MENKKPAKRFKQLVGFLHLLQKFALTKKEDTQTLLWLFDALQPLPTLPVPLNEGDPVAKLNLQYIFTDIFNKRQYGSYFNYQTKPPSPALKPSISQHLEKWLQKQG